MPKGFKHGCLQDLDGTEPEDEKKSDLKLTAEKKTDKEKTDAEQAE